jgi:hypothetical protein
MCWYQASVSAGGGERPGHVDGGRRFSDATFLVRHGGDVGPGVHGGGAYPRRTCARGATLLVRMLSHMCERRAWPQLTGPRFPVFSWLALVRETRQLRAQGVAHVRETLPRHGGRGRGGRPPVMVRRGPGRDRHVTRRDPGWDRHQPPVGSGPRWAPAPGRPGPGELLSGSR